MSAWKRAVRPLTVLGSVVAVLACNSPLAPPQAHAAEPVKPAPAGSAPKAAPAAQAAAVAQETVARVQGIDISHYQPTVDWDAVKTSVSFIFVKATDNTGVVDSRFAAHWSGAKKAGLPRGAYHFFHPKYDVDTQVANFTQHLKSDPGELPPVVDVEEFKHEYDSFTCEELAGKLQRFSQGVEKALGRKPMIYTNHQTWQMSFCNHPYFTDHFLWLAQYTSQPSLQPKLPAGWKRWHFWQYSESGKVAGISAQVDQSYFNGTERELKELFNTSKP